MERQSRSSRSHGCGWLNLDLNPGLPGSCVPSPSHIGPHMVGGQRRTCTTPRLSCGSFSPPTLRPACPVLRSSVASSVMNPAPRMGGKGLVCSEHLPCARLLGATVQIPAPPDTSARTVSSPLPSVHLFALLLGLSRCPPMLVCSLLPHPVVPTKGLEGRVPSLPWSAALPSAPSLPG